MSELDDIVITDEMVNSINFDLPSWAVKNISTINCEDVHYNLVTTDIINAYMLLVLAVFLIYGTWAFFSFASPKIIEKYYDVAMYMNKFSAILILGFVAFQFIYSYNALFPDVRPKFELLVKIVIGYLFFNLLYKAFWYFKDKKK